MLADMWMAASTERLSNRHRLTCALNADSICSHHPHIYISPSFLFTLFPAFQSERNEITNTCSLLRLLQNELEEEIYCIWKQQTKFTMLEAI